MWIFLFFLSFLLLFALAAVYTERKLAAFMQDRLGPMVTGHYGLLQTLADVLKLIQKEDIVPAEADKALFKMAPVIIFVAILSGFAFIPLNPSVTGSSLATGVFCMLTVISADVIGLLMAGWGSNNKFSLYGAIRSVSQLVSYEVPLGLSVLCVVITCQSLNLQEISLQQGIWWQLAEKASPNYLFGIAATGIDVSHTGGFLTWNIFRSPLLIPAFAIFFIASLAECNRAPFDLPEAESELVAGYQTEYSGFRWAMLMLAEYGLMMLVSLLAVVLFFGGWNTPLPNIGRFELAFYTSGEPDTIPSFLWGAFWLIAKALVLIGLQMWIRWTFPRLRVDQLMSLCWKYLTPAGILLLLLTAAWRLWVMI
jgi:NADH-quinone oxidoreductase subunit H